MTKETKNIPIHLGIIVDGNRRWARERGLPTFEGHRKGLKIVKKAIIWCEERGIKIFTLFIFSTENWKRSKREVNYLMKLFKQALNKKNIQKFHKDNIRIRVIGQKERLAKSLQKLIIVQAFQNILKKKIPPEKITENVISQNLWASDLDLIIRTGKEQRISNFLIWQGAYSEIYFLKKYWPDFTKKDLDKALADFSRRQRRFGK